MGLSPNISVPDLNQLTQQPSKTYAFDFNTGEIVGYVDGLDAVKQFVEKSIATVRYRFPIYTPNYGCELENLIERQPTMEFFKNEAIRLITEAIIYDNRIKSVKDFTFDGSTLSQMTISFTVETVDGTFTANEVIK